MNVADFATRFPLPPLDHLPEDLRRFEFDHCAACEVYAATVWTPRNALLLAAEARFIAEDAVPAVLFGDEHSLGDYVPEFAYGQSALWFARFRQVFVDLADRIEAGEQVEPMSIAEEFALAGMVSGMEAQWCMWTGREDYESLPEHPLDVDAALLADVLLHGHDVFEPFDMPATTEALDSWFEPFAGPAPVVDHAVLAAAVEYAVAHGLEYRTHARMPNAPFPLPDNPMVRYLFDEAVALSRAGLTFDAVVMHVIVHAWFEGSIEGRETVSQE